MKFSNYKTCGKRLISFLLMGLVSSFVFADNKTDLEKQLQAVQKEIRDLKTQAATYYPQFTRLYKQKVKSKSETILYSQLRHRFDAEKKTYLLLKKKERLLLTQLGRPVPSTAATTASLPSARPKTAPSSEATSEKSNPTLTGDEQQANQTAVASDSESLPDYAKQFDEMSKDTSPAATPEMGKAMEEIRAQMSRSVKASDPVASQAATNKMQFMKNAEHAYSTTSNPEMQAAIERNALVSGTEDAVPMQYHSYLTPSPYVFGKNQEPLFSFQYEDKTFLVSPEYLKERVNNNNLEELPKEIWEVKVDPKTGEYLPVNSDFDPSIQIYSSK